MPEAHAHVSLTLEASSARVAMRAGSPPPGGYAQFAYSAVERAATAAAAGDGAALASAPPLASRSQFVRSRRERDRSPRPALELRSGAFSLPRYAMRYDRLQHPPSRPVPYECHGHVWTSLRRGQAHTQQLHPTQPQAPQFPTAVLVHQHLSHHAVHVTTPASAASQPPPPPIPPPVPQREFAGVRVRGANAHPPIMLDAHAPRPLALPHQPEHFSRRQHMHYARDVFAPGPHIRPYASLHDGRDPHRQKVKYVNPSFANQRTYLAVCPTGIASVSVPQRVHRPGEVVTGSVFFDFAPGVTRDDASIIAIPDVWVCCEVARRQVNPNFCGGTSVPAEDISDVPVPPGRRPFVYHHYVNQLGQEAWRPVGLAHSPFNHCSDLIRGDNGAPLKVPTVTTARRVNEHRDAFDFEFVLPDDLPHSFSWPDSSQGPGNFLDIRYRLMVSLEIQPRPSSSRAAPSAVQTSGHSQQPYLHTPSANASYLPTSLPFTVTSSPQSSREIDVSSNLATTGSGNTSVGSLGSSGVPTGVADSARYMVVCESYLLLASSLMPSQNVYLSRTDLRIAPNARKLASNFLESAQQEIRVEILEPAARLDQPVPIRVTVLTQRELSSITCRCGIEESVFFGASPTKRASSVSTLMQMRQSVTNGRAVFLFTLTPQTEQLYPTSVVGPLAVRHAVVAYVSEYTIERPYAGSGADTFCARGRPALHVELPFALRPSVTPLDPNPYASSLAAPVILSQPPPMQDVRGRQSALDGLILRRDSPHGVCLRRRSAPAAPRPMPVLLKFGVREEDSEDDTCPICMTEVDIGTEIGLLSCDHYGHRECMEDMVEFSHKNRKDVLCPICRRRAIPVG